MSRWQSYSGRVGDHGVRPTPKENLSVKDNNAYDKVRRSIDNFIFVAGFPKTATTTACSELARSPDVALPAMKEPFFS